MNAIMTLDELSDMLRINKRRAYFFALKGKIPGGFKVGKAWRFRRDMVEQWIEEQTRSRELVSKNQNEGKTQKPPALR